MSTPTSISQLSGRLLSYLPAIYQSDPWPGQFLMALEKILLGRADDVAFPEVGVDYPRQSLLETISRLAGYFDPQQTPKEFLPWLQSWTALSLRADLDEKQQRDFIAQIIQLYRRRGTKQNIQELLRIFTIGVPEITETATAEFQIGVHSTLGEDTYLSGGVPHVFTVKISLPRLAPEIQARQISIARTLIELEKPAHTDYILEPIYPSMQISDHSTIGVDTLLGTGIVESGNA